MASCWLLGIICRSGLWHVYLHLYMLVVDTKTHIKSETRRSDQIETLSILSFLLKLKGFYVRDHVFT